MPLSNVSPAPSNFNYVTRLTPTELERSISRALEQSEFNLYYQPVMSLATGEIQEFEVLLRWHHPHLGLIAPPKFIAAAEESGLIVPLQRWIIETACKQLGQWQQDFSWDSKIKISINVPSLQLLQISLVNHLKFSLDKYRIAPESITWEISQYLIDKNEPETLAILSYLKQLGIGLQIDNFGGVAAIYGKMQSNSLYQQFDRAKIDRHLITQIAKDRQSWDIFRKIILHLKTQQLKITTTGIESLSQLNKVKEIAADYGQGYLLSQPLNAKNAREAIDSSKTISNKSIINKSRLGN